MRSRLISMFGAMISPRSGGLLNTPSALMRLTPTGDVGEQVAVDVDGDRHLGRADVGQRQVEQAGVVRRRTPPRSRRSARETGWPLRRGVDVGRRPAAEQQQAGAMAAAPTTRAPGREHRRAAVARRVACVVDAHVAPHSGGRKESGPWTATVAVKAWGTSRASGKLTLNRVSEVAAEDHQLAGTAAAGRAGSATGCRRTRRRAGRRWSIGGVTERRDAGGEVGDAGDRGRRRRRRDRCW